MKKNNEHAQKIVDKIKDIDNSIYKDIKRSRPSTIIVQWDDKNNRLTKSSKQVLQHMMGLSTMQIQQYETKFRVYLRCKSNNMKQNFGGKDNDKV